MSPDNADTLLAGRPDDVARPSVHTPAAERLPSLFTGGDLALPLIGSPMFICSYPELVLAQCKAGIVGTFPSLNARPLETLDQWLTDMRAELDGFQAANPNKRVAPFGVNLIVHKSNSRLEADLELVVKHKVPFIITSVGPPTAICDAVHSYGGAVFHDVTNIKHAKKAISCGVDGLILVAAGAGGHAGTASPFALVAEVREFYDGPIVLSGAMSHGYQLKAAQLMGADLGYMGTRFIATQEANAAAKYKDMIVGDTLKDIVYTQAFSGIPGNYLRSSVIEQGFDPDDTMSIPGARKEAAMDLSSDDRNRAKAWKDIWSAGQGIGTIHEVPSVQEVVDRLVAEYNAAPDPRWG